MARHPLLSILTVLAWCTASLAAGAWRVLGARRQPASHALTAFVPDARLPPPATDSLEERLQYSPGGTSGRFVPLGNLTMGGTATDTVCLCTDRSAAPDAAGGK